MRTGGFCDGTALAVVRRCGAVLARVFFGCSGNAPSNARRYTALAHAIPRRRKNAMCAIRPCAASPLTAVSHCGTARSPTVRRCAISPLTAARRRAASACTVLCRSGSAISSFRHCGAGLSLTVSRLRTASMHAVHPCIRPNLASFVRNPPHTVERSRPSLPSRRGLHGFQNPFVVHFAQQGEQLFLLHSGIPSFCISSLSLRRIRARIVRIAPSLRPVRRASSAISSRNQ